MNYSFQILEGEFQRGIYLQYINETELGHDITYKEAAKKASDLCKKVKASNGDK